MELVATETLDFAGNTIIVRMRVVTHRHRKALDLLSAIQLAVVETALQTAELSLNVDSMLRQLISLAR